MSLRLKKIIAASAGIVLLAAWFAYGVLENAYVQYPRTPNISEGRVIAYSVKGAVVYITPTDQEYIMLVSWAQVISGIVIAIICIIHKGDPFRRRKEGQE